MTKSLLILGYFFVIFIGVKWIEDWSCCSLCKTEDVAQAKSKDKSSENQV